MKKFSIFLVLAVLGMFLLAGTTMADTMYFPDTVYNWPGQSGAAQDVIGGPQITGFDVTLNESSYLTQINVYFDKSPSYWTGGRLSQDGTPDSTAYPDISFMDSLFISTSGAWDSWDYYIQGVKGDSAIGTYTGYYVGDQYQYIYAKDPGMRNDHASGIIKGLTLDEGGFGSVNYDDTSNLALAILTYTFESPFLKMGTDFSVGYTPYCANDVVLNPVPEPATMLLLGFGLIGIAGLGRKKFFKKG